jgi:two-component system cell cycle response regulator
MTESETANILVVDHGQENTLILENLPEAPDLKIVRASSDEEAVRLSLESDFALVLLDLQMSKMDGFETARRLRNGARTRDLPIIFVTEIPKGRDFAINGHNLVAIDYVFKPLVPHILKSKVSEYLRLYRHGQSLEKTNRKLNQTVARLKKINTEILEQQKSVIRDERLNILLEMAGAAAHELNQPLMGLLGYIDMMRLHSENPDKLNAYFEKIEETGLRISDIIKKMQTIRHYETKDYINNSAIIDFDQKINAIAVGVSAGDYELMRKSIKDQEHVEWSAETDPESALNRLSRDRFDIIFCGYHLPGGNALDFIRRLNEKRISIPVVVIPGQEDERIASRVMQSGAYDCLPVEKFTKTSIARVVSNVLEKSRLKAEIKNLVRRMSKLSTNDGLTGLYNRRYFDEVLVREVSRAIRYDIELVTCILELDHFRRVNHKYGLPAGDMVLLQLGRMLRGWVRQSDLVCRYGGEKFALILPNTPSEKAALVCERFRKMIMEHSFEYKDSSFQVTVSIGMSSIKGSRSRSPYELIGFVDQALSQAIAEGRNRVIEYTADR